MKSEEESPSPRAYAAAHSTVAASCSPMGLAATDPRRQEAAMASDGAGDEDKARQVICDQPPLSVHLTVVTDRPESKRILKRLSLPAMGQLPLTRVWFLYNDGKGPRARHAFVHAQYDLPELPGGPLAAPSAYLARLLGRRHIFLRYDMTARTTGDESSCPSVVLQEHWSETDPSGIQGSYSVYKEGTLGSDPLTRDLVKGLILRTWGHQREYYDAGVASDLIPGGCGSNNCVTFAERLFDLLTGKATGDSH